MEQSNHKLVFHLKALPGFLALALAACGGNSGQGEPSASLAANVVGNPKGADNKPAAPATPAVAAVPYTVTVIAPDGDAWSLNAVGQAIYSRMIGGSYRWFFYDGKTSIELPGVARALNNNGQVAGTSADNRFYFWSQATGTIFFGTTQEPYAGVTGINDAGQVIGYMSTSDGRGHAFLWTQAGGLVDMGTFGGKNSVALAINNNGQVVGQANMSGELGPLRDDGFARAFIWTQSGGMVNMQNITLSGGGWDSEATHINSKGQAAGFLYQRGQFNDRAFFWSPEDGMSYIGLLGGEQSGSPGSGSRCTALNDAGQVVGSSPTADGSERGFIWEKATGMVDLGTLGGRYSLASDINQTGQVVGETGNANGTLVAFIWNRKTGMVDLNTRLQKEPAGMLLSSARKIFDNGTILAQSNMGIVLLKPVNAK